MHLQTIPIYLATQLNQDASNVLQKSQDILYKNTYGVYQQQQTNTPTLYHCRYVSYNMYKLANKPSRAHA